MSLFKFNFRDNDRGYRDLKRRVLGPDNTTLRVGVFEKAGQTPYGASSTGLFPVTVLQVALFNEFGTIRADGSVHIPPRPFIRLYFDGQSGRVDALVRASVQTVITKRFTKAQALERLGMKISAEIKAAMGVGYFGGYDKNADATIKNKGFDLPLIETGQLRDAISYKVDLNFKDVT